MIYRFLLASNPVICFLVQITQSISMDQGFFPGKLDYRFLAANYVLTGVGGRWQCNSVGWRVNFYDLPRKKSMCKYNFMVAEWDSALLHCCMKTHGVPATGQALWLQHDKQEPCPLGAPGCWRRWTGHHSHSYLVGFRWGFWRVSAVKGPQSFCSVLLQRCPAEGASTSWNPNSPQASHVDPKETSL